MKYFAIIVGNQVTNCIVADSEEIALSVSPKNVIAIEYSTNDAVGAGYTYDSTTKNFYPPAEIDVSNI
jgi:hypothetical protein